MKLRHSFALGSVAVGLLSLVQSGTLSAQQAETPTSWRFGLQAGLNVNFIGTGYQNLIGPAEGSFITFKGVDGVGFGPSVGLFGEYKSRGWWGLQLRALYDSYSGTVTDESKPSKDEFDVNMAYLTLHPALRIQFPSSDLYATVGPTLSFNMTGEYDYRPGGITDPTLTAVKVPDVNSMSFGAIAGFGYDIRTAASVSGLPLYISPFLEGGWIVQQRSNSFPDDQDKFDDTWSTVSLRLGAQFKLGIPDSAMEESDQSISEAIDLAVPQNGLRVLNVVEYFPMLNQVFFAPGSSTIPARYKVLSTSEAATFNENNVLPPSQNAATATQDQAERQQSVYYNVLNIYGARLRDNQSVTMKLIGSAPEAGQGQAMAQSVKDYLVNTFGLDASRITIEGRDTPRIPSGTARTPQEFRPLIEEENRRVELIPGSATIAKPVAIRALEDAPTDNDIVLMYNDNTKIKSWQVTISGEGKTTTFGPYTDPDQRILSSPILGENERGDFHAEIVANTEDGQMLTHSKDFELFRKPVDNSKTMYRYQILFDYAQSDAVRSYESFLRTELTPRIEPKSGVYVIGFTDNIGPDATNLRLSKDRAKEAKDILADELRKTGKNMPVQAIGYGEDDSRALFKNNLPEGRFFNRSVVIESIPSE